MLYVNYNFGNAGLLVGAALAVIIPEGIQMLYTQQFHGIKPALLKNYNYLK